MGGKPKTSTPADKRLKANKAGKTAPATVKSTAPYRTPAATMPAKKAK